jgi:hypothetical protein
LLAEAPAACEKLGIAAAATAPAPAISMLRRDVEGPFLSI